MTKHQKFSQVFNMQLALLPIRKIYADYPDAFSEAEQEEIAKTKIMYPALFAPKKIAGAEEPPTSVIKQAVSEYNKLHQTFASRPIPHVVDPKTGKEQKNIHIGYKPITIENVLEAKYVECQRDSKVFPVISKGLKLLGVNLTNGTKFWMLL